MWRRPSSHWCPTTTTIVCRRGFDSLKSPGRVEEWAIGMSETHFNADVTRKLCDRVGGRCSNPDCDAVTKGPGEGNRIASVGVAAHIHAAASGGPRYDESQTPTERAAFENGIWLCNNCSRLVDGNETTFLRSSSAKWKADAELAAAQRIGKAPTLPDPLPLSDEARPHMEGIAVGWLAHGMHPVKAWSFRPQKRSGVRPTTSCWR